MGPDPARSSRVKRCKDHVVHVVCEIPNDPPDLSRLSALPVKRKRDGDGDTSDNFDHGLSKPRFFGSVQPRVVPESSPDSDKSLKDAELSDEEDEEELVEDFAQEDQHIQDWETTEASIKVDTSEKPQLSEDDFNSFDSFIEADQSLRMWWYDMYERQDRGHVFVFGKVYDKLRKKFVSCTAIVKNIPRNVYVLPRQFRTDGEGNATQKEVNIPEDVVEELSEIFVRHQIHNWNFKKVARSYAFELPDVPAKTDYLKITYDYEQSRLSEDLDGQTFSRLFGVNTTPLEQLLVKRNIMGPCWIDISNAKLKIANDSWSTLEIIVENHKTINPLGETEDKRYSQTPPLTIMALKLQTVMNHQKAVNEIVAASAFVCSKVFIDEPSPIDEQLKTRFSVVRPYFPDIPLPDGLEERLKDERRAGFPCQVERTEFGLLSYLIARIHRSDPDVIVGHNFLGCDLDILLHRMKSFKIPHWHKLGRLKFNSWPMLQQGPGGTDESTYQERMVLSGRLMCDTYVASKDLIRAKSYHLTNLAREQLNMNRQELFADQIKNACENTDKLIRLARHCSFDAYLAMALMFKLQILPLTKELTNLAGNLWSRSMNGARANRNEFLLLHEFHRQKFICPNKLKRMKEVEIVDFGNENEGFLDEISLETETLSQPAKTKTYSGGLVLEPKAGLYNNYVLLLDFNSLYPSIIQEYNVCFTTVKRASLNIIGGEQSTDYDNGTVPDVPNSSIPQGILPRLVRTFVERRKQVKKSMKDPSMSSVKRMQMDIQQMALKLTANSMYGCLGYSNSRFYAKPLAMLITSKGREILQETVDLARESLELNVIYGDTDSIMIDTGKKDMAHATAMGEKLKQLVNHRYNILEIDIDGFYKHMLLLKKKKYAALMVTEWNGELLETIDSKGLDLVRRDWCDLSHDVSMRVLKVILSGQDSKHIVNAIRKVMRQSQKQICQGGIPLEKYVINKQLTKNPGEYSDSKSLPHVQVAKRMRQAGAVVKAGDTIPYVICMSEYSEENENLSSAQRAHHPDDVTRGKEKIDLEWYLKNQILPPVIRLCAPLLEIDAVQLAKCLGLDMSRKVKKMQLPTEPKQAPSYVQRFSTAERLLIRCPHCYNRNNLKTLIAQLDKELQCLHCDKVISTASVQVQLTLAIRKYINRYYDEWLVCSTDACEGRIRGMLQTGQCPEKGCTGQLKRKYTSEQLYTQIAYLFRLFEDVDAASAIMSEPLTVLKSTVEKYLQLCGYRFINFTELGWQ